VPSEVSIVADLLVVSARQLERVLVEPFARTSSAPALRLGLLVSDPTATEPASSG
jgi:hypothetical protein